MSATRIYVLRDERDGLVHLAKGDDPLGTMLCGAVVAKWYPVKARNVNRNVCLRCLVRRKAPELPRD